MDCEKIGSFICSRRKDKGLTQEQFAQMVGVSQKTVSRWETGKNMPDYSVLSNICAVLEINIAELLNAQIIEGENVSKEEVTSTLHTFHSIFSSKALIKNTIGAILTVIITIICMVWLYNSEFDIPVDSTEQLEFAINRYTNACGIPPRTSADVLESKILDNKLYVLYGQRDFPGASGIACLEKGLFGRYRIICSDNYNSTLINCTTINTKSGTYHIIFCVNDLPITEYGIPIIGSNDNIHTYDIKKYTGSPFFEISKAETDERYYYSSFDIKYYVDSVEIPFKEVDNILECSSIQNAPISGTASFELNTIYFFEILILIIGFILSKYYIIDIHNTHSVNNK